VRFCITRSCLAVLVGGAIGVVISCSSNGGGAGFGPADGGGADGSNGGSGGFGGSGSGGSAAGGSAAGGSAAGGSAAGGTGGTGTVACPDAATPPPCSPKSTGGLALTSNYLPASDGIGMGGYAYFYNDSMNGVGGTSTSCIESTALCTTGTTDISNTTGSFYGAGIGFNLNQAQATSCTSTPIDPFTVPSTSLGISYTLSNLPAGGARLIIGNATTEADGGASGTDYCAPLPAASGMIPWAKFNSECWTDQGTFLTGPPTAPIHVNIGLPSGTAMNSFDFCVTALSFGGTASSQDSGPGPVSCGGSACCEPTTGPSTTSGSLTCYTFAQGTPNDKTYCGYQGTSTAYTGGGSGACQTGALANTDSVPNVGTKPQYFAAFPGPGGSGQGGGFGNGTYCGMCINVTYAGTTLMATVVDECPSASNPQCTIGSNHLDLSAALARDLGYGVGSVVGDPTGITWKAAACPISSDIVEVFNGSSTQVYFQNVVWPVMSVKVNGAAASQPDGFWQLPAGSGPITLTDIYGHTVTGTLPGTNGGSLGVQFPATCD